MSTKETKEKPKKKEGSSSKATTKAKAKEPMEPAEAVFPRLWTAYKETVVPQMVKTFGYASAMQVPQIRKIVLNCGLGKSTQNIKIIDQAVKDLAAIAGQKPVTCKSKKAISNFKLRAGLPIGVMVTLRGQRMYEFLDRLLSLALPRIKDFRGISDKGFDGRGNYTLGLKDHLVFPEVEFDTADLAIGMNITVVTNAKTDDEGRSLLSLLGFPFRKKPQTQQKAA